MPRLIDADASVVAIRVAIKRMKRSDNSNWLEGYLDGLDAVCNTIEASPTIEAEPVKHGRWLDTMCSNCQKVALLEELDGDIGRITVYAYSNYCPNCGAKMDGGNDHE